MLQGPRGLEFCIKTANRTYLIQSHYSCICWTRAIQLVAIWKQIDRQSTLQPNCCNDSKRTPSFIDLRHLLNINKAPLNLQPNFNSASISWLERSAMALHLALVEYYPAIASTNVISSNMLAWYCNTPMALVFIADVCRSDNNTRNRIMIQIIEETW